MIQDDLKWSNYIQNDDKSLIKQLTSKLIFQISLWGGAEGYLLDALQKVQNKAARLVTRRGKYTPVVELLRHCGWLSVRQLAFYHSIIQVYKSKQTTYPKYIHSKLAADFPYNTRLADSKAVRMGAEFKSKLEITEKSFMPRATVNYNLLPTSIRQIETVEAFKEKLKAWVSENVAL